MSAEIERLAELSEKATQGYSLFSDYHTHADRRFHAALVNWFRANLSALRGLTPLKRHDYTMLAEHLNSIRDTQSELIASVRGNLDLITNALKWADQDLTERREPREAVLEEAAKVCDAKAKEFSFRSPWNLVRYVRAWQAEDDATAIRALKGQASPSLTIPKEAIKPGVPFDIHTEFRMKMPIVATDPGGLEASPSPSREAEVERLRDALEDAADALYNPFEPSNQSQAYKAVLEALKSPELEPSNAGSGNYVANKEIEPTEIKFANGRVVRAIGGYLEVSIES